MAKLALAVKYRPKTFNDLCEQKAIKDILSYQLETGTFQHAYLFTGPAGTGKTTSARIFANEINKGKGNPIEIDAASNSGVDNIRNVIEDSKRKPLDADYKIFIVDECHSLSNGAWQAMLKLLEEPPKFSIFILCTTDPQKIPATILSRVQRYQFNKISITGVMTRLQNILIWENENDANITFDIESIQYIAKIANGGMRDAITMLDKCLSLSTDLTIEHVLEALGTESYDAFIELLEMLCVKNRSCISIIDTVFNDGKDLKQFMKEFSKFILNVEKYLIFNNLDCTIIPSTYEKSLEVFDNDKVFEVMEFIIELNNLIKWEQDPLTVIQLRILSFCGR